MWFLGYFFCFVIAIALIREFAEPRTAFVFKAVVTVSWALGFSYVLVLPFDMADAFCRACDPTVNSCSCLPLPGIKSLSVLVPMCYLVTLTLGYLMNDLMRSFLESGEFTRRGRMKDALREIAYFYVPAIVIGVILVIAMMISTPELRDTKTLKQLSRGIFNTIGLFLLVALMSYGLVEVPLSLWNRGNIEGLLKYHKFQVAINSEALQSARRKLEETLELVHSTDTQLRAVNSSPELSENMAEILRRCSTYELAATTRTQQMRPASGGTITPPVLPEDVEPVVSSSTRSNRIFPFAATAASSAASVRGGTTKDEKLLPTTRKGLVALHLRVKRSLAIEKRQRAMYELSVRRALDFQNLFESVPASSSREAGLPPARDRLAGLPTAVVSVKREDVSRWHAVYKPLLFRAAAIFCGALSLVIVWCEGTILLDGPPFQINLSPLSYFYRWLGQGGGSLLVALALFVPLAYCALCTYFAVFNMKCCEGYTLYGNQNSDGGSLLFNATYACRLGPAICFNFLKLLHESDASGDTFYNRDPHGHVIKSYFSETAFGEMDQLPPPFGGDYFNNYAPLVIVVLCFGTYLNLLSGLLSCCAKCFPCLAAPSFSFDEDFSDSRIEDGATILAGERRALSEGASIGSNLQLLSGAGSDTEEANRGRGGRTRFNRLQDAHL